MRAPHAPQVTKVLIIVNVVYLGHFFVLLCCSARFRVTIADFDQVIAREGLGDLLVDRQRDIGTFPDQRFATLARGETFGFNDSLMAEVKGSRIRALSFFLRIIMGVLFKLLRRELHQVF